MEYWDGNYGRTLLVGPNTAYKRILALINKTTGRIIGAPDSRAAVRPPSLLGLRYARYDYA
eukprot:1280336-Pyramimonas_sp.AAC.1